MTDNSNQKRGTGSRPSGARPSGRTPRTSAGGAGRQQRPDREMRRPARPEREQDRKVSARDREKQKRKKILLFIGEVFALLIMVVVLYGVTKGEKVGKVELKTEDIVINEEVKKREETTKMKGYRNIALFGVDSTTGALAKNTRSDSIMIASINQDTGECRVVSVYRDTYLNLSNDTYNKCNTAYAKGGPEMAINMLNMNLDMNITDFVTVGFAGLTNTIDALGGIMIDVDEAEIGHLNSYQFTMAEDLKRSYNEVTQTGYQLLDGLQATAYCRIRYTAGDDFKRAERQREVLMAVAEKARTASPAVIDQIANEVFNEIYTSLDLSEILELLTDIAKYRIVDQAGFPHEDYRKTGDIGSKGSCVIPVDLSENVEWLHQFLFQEEYSVSESVETYSSKIKGDTAAYLK